MTLKPSQVPPAKITPTKNLYDSQKKDGKKLTPKKEPKADENKIHNIFIFNNPDGSAYGWFFFGFYACKELLKTLTNKNGAHTYYGVEEFKPFSNLTCKWVPDGNFKENLWVIRIEKTKNQDDFTFPVKCHTAFANKIARAVVKEGLWEGELVDVILAPLNQHEVTNFNSKFSDVPFFNKALFQESIKAVDDDLEELI